jgi:hypothetical protein
VYGAGADERFVVAAAANGPTLARLGRPARNLVYVGDRVFFPVGAPLVRITFRSSPAGLMLTVHDPDLVVEARRQAFGLGGRLAWPGV